MVRVGDLLAIVVLLVLNAAVAQRTDRGVRAGRKIPSSRLEQIRFGINQQRAQHKRWRSIEAAMIRMRGGVRNSDIVSSTTQCYKPSCRLRKNVNRDAWFDSESIFMKLYFSIPKVRSTMYPMITARLKLQVRHSTGCPCNSDVPDGDVRVELYQITRPRGRTKLLIGRTISMTTDLIADFDVSRTVSFWSHHTRKNFGFEIRVKNIDGPLSANSVFVHQDNCDMGEDTNCNKAGFIKTSPPILEVQTVLVPKSTVINNYTPMVHPGRMRMPRSGGNDVTPAPIDADIKSEGSTQGACTSIEIPVELKDVTLIYPHQLYVTACVGSCYNAQSSSISKCQPTRTRSQSVLLLSEDKNKIKHALLPNFIVDQCSCG